MVQKTMENSIAYFTPQHGKAESQLKVPESYRLYVCPSACGRRFAINALSNREKDSVSCLYITEADVVSGHYEEIIGDAVGELLAELRQTPKAFILYFHCIDDLLGTDEQALLKRLREQHPSLRFAVCHIDPIALEEKIKPTMRVHNQIYGLLDYTGKKDNGVNLMSHFVAIDPESEFFRVLSGWDIQVRQLFDRKTFTEFLQMADSRLNLVMSPVGKFAAQNMAKKLDIPYLMNITSYDIDDIEQTYHVIADMLGKKCPDFRQEIERTWLAVRKARKHIKNMPVIVDYSATRYPFGMAKALCRYGFNVQAVFFIREAEDDSENRKWLASYSPQFAAVRSQNYELVLGAGFGRDCIAIGFDCGYTLQARHFVDIRYDETFYGFHGVRKLMRLIHQAYDTTADWERIKEMDKELLRL